MQPLKISRQLIERYRVTATYVVVVVTLNLLVSLTALWRS